MTPNASLDGNTGFAAIHGGRPGCDNARPAQESRESGDLLVGAAETDITPAAGIHMGGDLCRFRPVEKVLDPLYARALVAESGGTRICLLSLDLCTPGNAISDSIREMIARRFGFDTRAVMFHLLQNHSAPSIGTHLLFTADSPYVSEELWWVCQGDPNYIEFLIPKIMEVVREAIDRMEPADMACGGMADSRIAFNRRFIMRDGSAQTQPVERDKILCPEGPTDPEVGVACFRNKAGQIIAALLHHTAHPVSHFGKNWVTASWPGAWAAEFRKTVGDRCVPIVLNGCCGNVNRWSDAAPWLVVSDEQIGQWLTETAQQVVGKMQWRESGAVGYAAERFPIPHGDIKAQLGNALDKAREIIAKEPRPRWTNEAHTAVDIEWLFAAASLDMERRIMGRSYTYETQAFRIGELGIVGLIGEPFVEGQLNIKLQSPGARTFVAHMCNGWIGYIPTLSAHNARNYNFLAADGTPVRRGANLFFLAPDALDTITAKSLSLLTSLFRPSAPLRARDARVC